MLTSLLFLFLSSQAAPTAPEERRLTPLVITQLGGVSSRRQNRAREKPVKYILVDLQAQRLYAFEGLEKKMEFRISSGAAATPTPTGSFRIKQKQLEGKALPKYGGDKLPYAQRLQGHTLIHSYKSVPDYPASHGCIRMRKADARRLYFWTSLGTRVEVVANSNDCLL
jgi:lipoprotein-anchoring transpeptidase ErfK/SrfK